MERNENSRVPSSWGIPPFFLLFHPVRSAVLISLLYAIVAAVYIWISGNITANLASSVGSLQHMEKLKGLFFVGFTGIGLFILQWVLFRRIAQSERKMLQQQDALLTAERHAVANLSVYSVAHDLNNVLQTLGLLIEQLNFNNDLPQSARNDLKILQHTHHDAVTLSNQFMQSGKNRSEQEKQTFEVQSLLKDLRILTETHETLRTCKVSLDRYNNELISGYSMHYKQIFYNLLINAAEATGNNGLIHLIIDSGKETLTIEVHDNGPGIPADDVQKIFEPLYTTKSSGTGLGLLSVKSSVEELGGTVQPLVSEELGGACFRIEIPQPPIESLMPESQRMARQD